MATDDERLKRALEEAERILQQEEAERLAAIEEEGALGKAAKDIARGKEGPPEPEDPFEAIQREAREQMGRELPPREALPQPPSADEIAARLRLKDAEVLQARQKAGYDRKSIQNRHAPGQSYHRGLAVGMAVAYNLVGSVLAGWLIGAAVDWATKGFLGQAIGTVIGAIIGMIAALLVIYRAPGGPSPKRGPEDRKPNP